MTIRAAAPRNDVNRLSIRERQSESMAPVALWNATSPFGFLAMTAPF